MAVWDRAGDPSLLPAEPGATSHSMGPAWPGGQAVRAIILSPQGLEGYAGTAALTRPGLEPPLTFPACIRLWPHDSSMSPGELMMTYTFPLEF